MLGKVETPIFILAFFYVAIVVVVLIFVTLLLFSCTGVSDFIHNQKTLLMSRHCKIYAEQGKTLLYDGCVKQARAYED
jgi:ABC-type lipoprotein release transport system permease subunit